jgi:nucleoside-diphosphate-sugar epimerase
MEKPQSTVLVTGAAGLIGQHTLRSLAIRGRSVIAMYRSKIPETMENVIAHHHDLRDLDGLSSTLRNVETVVHLAWEGGIVGAGEETEGIQQTIAGTHANIEMIKNLLKAMEQAGTKRIVFFSALGASPKAEASFLREKYHAEHLILNSRIREKIIIRSTIVWTGRGETDPFLRTVIRLLKYPFYPLPSKTALLAPVHARDVSRIIAEACTCLVHDGAGFFEIKGAESLPLVDVCKIVSEKFIGKPRFPIKGIMGKALLPLIERDTNRSAKMPKIMNFVGISGSLGDAAVKANPLMSLGEGKFASFREHVAEP